MWLLAIFHTVAFVCNIIAFNILATVEVLSRDMVLAISFAALAYSFALAGMTWQKLIRRFRKNRCGSNKSKMYILVNEEALLTDASHTYLSIAHAVAAASRQWADDVEYNQWVNKSFRKVLCLANSKEFAKAKDYNLDRLVMTEEAVPGMELTIVFKPQEEFPRFFRFLRML
tara:strand:+ start:826 stop:1341 length:516 start_codon:yes stop_codon:yes gene_type:complete